MPTDRTSTAGHTHVVQRITAPDTTLVPMASLTREERTTFHNQRSTWGNPADEFDKKITRLARFLNCSEEEATNIFLHHV